MKRIKLFFLAFLSVCLWLTSFSSAFNIWTWWLAYLDSVALNTWSFTNAYLPILYEIPSPSSDNIQNLCVVFKNFSRSADINWGLRYADTNSSTTSNAFLYATTTPYSLYCVSWWRKTFYINTTSSSNRVSAEKFWVFQASEIWSLFSSSVCDCTSDPNYLQCLDDKNRYMNEAGECSDILYSCF